MIKVSGLYPAIEGGKFDIEYYLEQHVPMALGKLGDACRGIIVEEGLFGARPGDHAAYMVMGHLLFESLDAFRSAFAPHVAAITGDVVNFTNITPTTQVSEVRLAR